MDILTSPLLTDLYQLTMLQGYVEEELFDEAVFEFYVRQMPKNRSFLVAAGLESCLAFLENMAFSDEEILYLERTKRFSSALLDYLKTLRFQGDVHALPEGTIFFPKEPLIRVTAPLPVAQLVETRLINFLHFETLIASKAARCVIAARGRASLVDFGLRRAHGAEAGLLAARASCLAGFIGTATVPADLSYGIPLFGTMAHSYVEVHADEETAFFNFALANPANVTLLIDTYDTLKGARIAAKVAAKLAERHIRVQAVRLDSGDLLSLSKAVRVILDSSGFPDIHIFASGNLDEFAVADLLAQGAPIDGFGIGTRLDTSDDVPYLECAYKLMEYAGVPRLKKSSGKITYPGRKQVYRTMRNNRMSGDIIALEDESPVGVPLIMKVMDKGKRLRNRQSLPELASYTAKQRAGLPPTLCQLTGTGFYPVRISDALIRLKEETERRLV
ncbi:MAG: nicotinate phosphoribosyltransferase [Deltaproteobacteria bacterium]|nr:nicotinate phosphoribosyltransferase [Deltaproteobacteria bacterium]